MKGEASPPPAADVGVALLNLGGPWHLDGIRPFLSELFADREIIRLSPFPFLQPLIARLIIRARIRDVEENYRAIGGGSPLLRTTVAQGAALRRELARRGIRARVMPAMRYARPRARDAVAAFRRAGCRRALALTLYPQFSTATTGSSLKDLERTLASDGGPPLRWLPPVREFPDHPRYVEAVAATVRGALRRVSPARRDSAVILFSGHGLPQHFIDDGDPYVDQILRTKKAVMDRLAVRNPVHLSWQSRAGPVKWLKPDTDTVVRDLGASGVKAMVVVPVSFVSDHIETLYEIEMLYGNMAREAGIEEYIRVPAVNADAPFVAALADLVEERVRADGGGGGGGAA